MAYPPPLTRKSSAPWDRLKPAKQDPLESMGYVSRGDTRLLDLKTQESFYHKITARYMNFCTQHSKDLDQAFASLSLNDDIASSSDPARNPPTAPMPPGTIRPLTPSPPKRTSSSPVKNGPAPPIVLQPSNELSTILMALRKLRESLLATSSTAPSPVFSQRVHIFNIRLSILALHPPSYHPSLLHLLFVLHSKQYPLPRSELAEMTSYLILDLACRQRDLAGAYALRSRSKAAFGFENRNVNALLTAIASGNWVLFWRIRRKVDGYVRAVIHWEIENLRKSVLKAIGRAYMGCDVGWILESATGDEMTWDELVEKEDVGWIKENERVMIRKPKPKSGFTLG